MRWGNTGIDGLWEVVCWGSGTKWYMKNDLFPSSSTATSIRLLMTQCMTDRREQRRKRVKKKIPTVSVMEHGSAKCLRSLFLSITHKISEKHVEKNYNFVLENAEQCVQNVNALRLVGEIAHFENIRFEISLNNELFQGHNKVNEKPEAETDANQESFQETLIKRGWRRWKSNQKLILSNVNVTASGVYWVALHVSSWLAENWSATTFFKRSDYLCKCLVLLSTRICLAFIFNQSIVSSLSY